MPSIQSKSISVQGARLHYQEAGSGTALVFIHGFGLDLRMWDSQFFEFSKKYRAIRYDLRGFGKSDLPVEGEPYRHHDDLKAMLDQLGIDKVVLVGLSLGGRIATAFAIDYPDRVAGLVLVDSVLEGYAMKDYVMTHIYDAAKEGKMQEALQSWYEHPTFETAREKEEVSGPLRQMIEEYSGWHFVHKNPMLPMSPPCIDQLDKIRARTLVIVGEKDLPDMRDISDLLHQKIAGSTLEIIPMAGHMSNMEQPEEFNRILGAFLEWK